MKVLIGFVPLFFVAGTVQAQELRPAEAPPLPATCVEALRTYESLDQVPRPWQRLPTQPRIGKEDVRLAYARIGANGTTIERVPEAELTQVERTLMSEHGVTEVFRSVPLFIPADSARAQQVCRSQAGA